MKFIEYKGKRVLFNDYAGCDIAMVKAISEEMHRVISKEPPNSVLTLNDVTGTSFDSESVAILRSKVAANAPYVKRAAVFGVSGLQQLIYEGIQKFSERRIPSFKTRQEALEYLVKE